MKNKAIPPLKRGEDNGNAKLKESQVKEIHTLWATKKFQRHELAEKFGVSKQTIMGVLSGRLWKHLFPGKQGNSLREGEAHVAHKLTGHQVREIRRRRLGETCECLALEFGVSQSVICEIGLRKAWKHLKDIP